MHCHPLTGRKIIFPYLANIFSVECAVDSIKELFDQPLKGMLEVYGNQVGGKYVDMNTQME